MTLELYKQVALTRDIPEAKLYKGDVAVLVDFMSILQAENRVQF
jgi:hypothetical protein